MEKEHAEKYLLAGKIASKVRTEALSMIAPGKTLLSVAEFVESETVRLGGKTAFPTNISADSQAAHYTPVPNDALVFKEGSIVKLDIGVHVDGFIADTAATKVLSDNPELLEMKRATEDALLAASKALFPGAPVSEIGAAIEGAILARGFKPIYNLTGHLLKRYDLHAGLSIPNYRALKGTIPESCALAIEPFATSGDGYVENGPNSEIYLLNPEKKLRLPQERVLSGKLQASFATLPFSSRWIQREDFPLLKRLVLSEAVHNYPVLIESSGAPVAQTEHTFLLSDGIVRATTE